MKRLYFLSSILLATPALAQGAAPPQASGMLAQHPLLWCLLAAVVGAGLGGWLIKRVLTQEHQVQLQQARQQGRDAGRREAGPKVVKPITDYELQLRKEKLHLEKQLDAALEALKRQGKSQGKAERRPSRAAAPAPPDAEPATVAALPTNTPANEPPLEAPPLPESAYVAPPEVLSFARYAPAQETGFLRDNKLATEPLPQLPLLLTLNPDDPEKAAFTLNPHVNQAKLIGDGLHQLREWFDFDLPTGRIVAVSADAPGQLARQGDGWQVVSRARLLVR